MTDFQRLTILAHMYANAILKEYKGSYKRAYQLGMLKAQRKLNNVLS
jgi:hypothetical protein